MITYISLFSGIGGFDLGFDRAGLCCLAQVELDPKASAALQPHWPNVKRYKDVRDVGKYNLPTPDVLCGGFPCQDVSVAGKRTGLDGERSRLWFEYLRIVQELKPRWVVIENVPGLLSSQGGRDFATILRGLADCGYCVAYRILDSQYFGVAQRRRRVFIVASFGNGSAAQILFEPTGGAGDTQPRRPAGQGTPTYFIKGAAIGRQPENGPQPGEISADGTSYTLNTREVQAVAGTFSASGAGTARTGNARHETSFLIPVAAQTERLRGFGDYTPDGCASSLKARAGKDATDLITQAIDVRNLKSNGDLSGTLQSKPNGGYSLNYQNPIVFMAGQGAQARSIAASETVAPTLRSAASGTNQAPSVAFQWNASPHYSLSIGLDIAPAIRPDPLAELPAGAFGVRRLTPAECERLQGFPDGHTAVNGQSDSSRYQQLGNAVTVNVAEWLGQRIMQAAVSEWFGTGGNP